MRHEIKEQDGVIIVAIEGDVDLQSSPEVRKILLESVARKASVVVDMSGIGYIDSSGVASLVEALQTARKGGTSFSLAALSDGASRVLQLARLDKIFTIYDALDEALAQEMAKG
ncbi:MAG TPA: anti-sigma factor antagonist [Rhodospirillales bacterium]|nr:anti-sigma factor antagonist [Rhodospirillales bacterium]